MKDASDLRVKAKSRRAQRRSNSYRDVDRVNFRNEKEYKRHERTEMDDEQEVEMETWQLGKRKN